MKVSGRVFAIAVCIGLTPVVWCLWGPRWGHYPSGHEGWVWPSGKPVSSRGSAGNRMIVLLRQLHLGQDIYFKEYDTYASTLDELISSGIMVAPSKEGLKQMWGMEDFDITTLVTENTWVAVAVSDSYPYGYCILPSGDVHWFENTWQSGQ